MPLKSCMSDVYLPLLITLRDELESATWTEVLISAFILGHLTCLQLAEIDLRLMCTGRLATYWKHGTSDNRT